MLSSDVKPGAFIAFTYNPPHGLASNDPSKECMVLNPDWRGNLHCIDLKRVTPAERMVLQMIMDPKTKEDLESIPYPLVRDILKRVDAPVVIASSPLRFYQSVIKPFVRNKDVYRQFKPQYVSGVKVLQPSQIQGPMKPFVQAPGFKPLFKANENKGTPFKPSSGGSGGGSPFKK